MHARLLNIQDPTDDQKDKISSCISEAIHRRSGLAFSFSMTGLLPDEFRPSFKYKKDSLTVYNTEYRPQNTTF